MLTCYTRRQKSKTPSKLSGVTFSFSVIINKQFIIGMLSVCFVFLVRRLFSYKREYTPVIIEDDSKYKGMNTSKTSWKTLELKADEVSQASQQKLASPEQ